MLTAWGSASAFRPLLIAHLRQVSGSYASGLHIIAEIMAVSVLLPLFVSPPRSGVGGRKEEALHRRISSQPRLRP
jgi:hypothetical protein